VRFGCVVRVESIGQDLTTNHWMSLAWGVQPRHSPRVVPMAGACEMRRPWGGVSFWDKAPGVEVPSRYQVLVIPFEKISYPIPLRTGMLRELDHGTLRTHQLLLNRWGTVTQPTRMVPLLLGWKWIV
jgi:hypothetical protein